MVACLTSLQFGSQNSLSQCIGGVPLLVANRNDPPTTCLPTHAEQLLHICLNVPKYVERRKTFEKIDFEVYIGNAVLIFDDTST